MVSTTCSEQNVKGGKCGAYVLKGRSVCFHHAPELREKRREAKSRGGRARHGRKIGTTGSQNSVASELVGQVKIETTADLMGLIEVAVADCLALERSLARARTLGYLSEKAAIILGWTELDRRLADLESDTHVS